MQRLTFSQIEFRAREAELFWQRRQFAEALESYRSLLQQRLSEITQYSLDFQAQDVFIAERIADLSLLLGFETAAENLLSGVVELTRQAGNVFAASYLHLKKILLVLRQGELRRSFNLLAELQQNIGEIEQIAFTNDSLPVWESRCYWGEAVSEADKTVVFALLYLIFGEILAGLGRYGEALAAVNRGLDLTETGAPDLAGQARPHLFLAKAKILLECGELAASDKVLTGLTLNENYAQSLGLQINVWQIEGKTALLRGNLGKALEKFRSILNVCEKDKLSRGAEKATLNLAQVLIFLNQTAKAGEILDDLLHKNKSDGDSELSNRIGFLQYLAKSRSGTLAQTVSLSVTKLWNVGQEVESSPPTELANLPVLRQDTNYLAFFEDRTLTFYFYLAAQDWTNAAAQLQNLRDIFAHTDSDLIHLRLKLLSGLLLYYKNEFAQAEQELIKCGAEMKEKNLLPELWQSSRILSWCQNKLQRPADEQAALAAETEILLDRMTASLTGADQSIFLLNKWTADEEALATEINHLAQLKSIAEKSSWLKRWRIQYQIRQRLHYILEQIDRFKSELAGNFLETEDGNFANSKKSLWQRLWQHPRDQATILFLVLPDRVFVARLGWLSIDFVVSAISRIQLREVIQQWHRSIVHSFRSQTEDTEPSQEAIKNAAALTEKLQLTELLDDLPKVKKITFVPDDCLHGFPFAALSYHGKYLIEDFKISYAFSSAPEHKSPKQMNKRALNVGINKGGGNFAPLPGVRLETRNFTRWLEKGKFDATIVNDIDSAIRPEKSFIGEILPRVSLAHFACHGDFDLKKPADSGLVINAQKNEILSLKELSKLDLNELRHITLSACWSADHHILPGRRVVGLAETLLRVGTGSVLGSFWQADDRATLRLMKKFYEYSDSLPLDEALRQAQIDLLARQSGEIEYDTRSPYFWAGFALYGDCARLQL